jgi:hypothetical protein
MALLAHMVTVILMVVYLAAVITTVAATLAGAMVMWFVRRHPAAIRFSPTAKKPGEGFLVTTKLLGNILRKKKSPVVPGIFYLI